MSGSVVRGLVLLCFGRWRVSVAVMWEVMGLLYHVLEWSWDCIDTALPPHSLDECTLDGLVEEVVVVVMPLIQKRPEQMEPVLTHVLVRESVNIFFLYITTR